MVVLVTILKYQTRLDLSPISIYCFEASGPYLQSQYQMPKKKKESNFRRFPGIGSVLKHVCFDARQFAFSVDHF